MEFLRLLVNLRTPFLDALFGTITYLGDETLFMIVAMVFFWCVEKRKGYFLLFTGFCGTLINQFLKMLFCVPRPWLIDPSFPIVENARAAATGYSFPSGHTQNITGTFGGIARFTGRRWLRACAIAVARAIPGTLLYETLGAPADPSGAVRIGHPSGVMTMFPYMDDPTKANFNTIDLSGVAVQRTARRIMDGYIYIRD